MVATIGYITTSIDVRCEFAVPFDPRTDHALRAFLNLILFLFSHLLLTLLLFILCPFCKLNRKSSVVEF